MFDNSITINNSYPQYLKKFKEFSANYGTIINNNRFLWITMDLTTKSNLEVTDFLAATIRSERLRQGYSQQSFAFKAGISLRTYKRMELSGDGSIHNLILILRTLGRIRAIEILFPPILTKPHVGVVERVKEISMKRKLF